MAVYPAQVQAFHDAVGRLTGVVEVTTGLKWLEDFPVNTLSLPGEIGDMPHALLRRTSGGLKDEAWANTEIVLSRDEYGWLALEFLAWWVRDLSRAGHAVQMRPGALPPRAYEVQLGRTLKFIIDHFAICPGRDPTPMLELLQDRARWLGQNLDDYAKVLGKAARPRASP
jgi:hypothetical protein